MKAIILSAGLGTRLRPLTDRIPKPLIPVANRPLIDVIVETLKSSGFSRFGINLHHLPDALKEHLQRRPESFSYSLEPEILDTGGGIARFASFVKDDDCFLVHNGDIVCTVNLAEVLRFHRERRAFATLVLVHNPPTNVVSVLPDGTIADIRGKLGFQADTMRRLTFSGIAVYSGEIFERMPRVPVFSIIDFLLGEIEIGEKPIMGFIPAPPCYWRDVGSITSYLELHRDLLTARTFRPPGIEIPRDGRLVAADAVLGRQVALDGFVVVGSRASIEEDVYLKDVVVLPGATVPSGTRSCGAVFTDTVAVEV